MIAAEAEAEKLARIEAMAAAHAERKKQKRSWREEAAELYAMGVAAANGAPRVAGRAAGTNLQYHKEEQVRMEVKAAMLGVKAERHSPLMVRERTLQSSALAAFQTTIAPKPPKPPDLNATLDAAFEVIMARVAFARLLRSVPALASVPDQLGRPPAALNTAAAAALRPFFEELVGVFVHYSAAASGVLDAAAWRAFAADVCLLEAADLDSLITAGRRAPTAAQHGFMTTRAKEERTAAALYSAVDDGGDRGGLGFAEFVGALLIVASRRAVAPQAAALRASKKAAERLEEYEASTNAFGDGRRAADGGARAARRVGTAARQTGERLRAAPLAARRSSVCRPQSHRCLNRCAPWRSRRPVPVGRCRRRRRRRRGRR